MAEGSKYKVWKYRIDKKIKESAKVAAPSCFSDMYGQKVCLPTINLNHLSLLKTSTIHQSSKLGKNEGEIGQNDAARLRDGLLTGRRLTPWKRSFVGAAFLPKKYRAAKKRKNKGNFGKLPVRVRLRSLIKIRFFFGGKETAKVGEKERKRGEPPGSGAVTRDRGLRGWGMSWPFLGFG